MCGLCKNGVLLIRIECKCCFIIFFLCRRCFRGHAYCSDQCRGISKRDAHRIAQSKYRTSEKGRKVNKEAERRRRMNKRQKSVADRGSIRQSKVAIMSPFSLMGKIACLFCGASGTVVARFPRRGYRPTSYDKERLLKKDEAGSVQTNPNDRRYYEYRKNIGPNPNSPDP